MPYLRVTCPEVDIGRRRKIAQALTEAVVQLFFDPRALLSSTDLRERTTVHFTPYGDDELFIGGRTPLERGVVDVTIELSDWAMSLQKQRRVARELTPVAAGLFGVAREEIENVNIRFHPYPPKDLAVGGKLLIDVIPWIGRFFKSLSR